MKKLLWWHVAVIVTAVVLAVLLFVEGASGVDLFGGLASLAFLAIGWFALGRMAECSGGWWSVGLMVIVAVACGFGTGFDPLLACMQCVGYPLVWYFAGSTRRALIGNIVLVAAVGVGFLFANGTSQSALVATGITCALSLGLSLGLGLWFSRVYNTIDERQALIDQLEAAQSQLAALSRDAGASGERERLVREIHDTIAQDLAGLVLTAQRGTRELESGDTAAAREQLAILEDTARNALAETRALVASGAAVGTDGSTLATALRRLGARFERETGILVTVNADDTAVLDRDSEVVLLRCAQEALANVRKHSKAAAASLSLTSDEDGVSLSVADDGTGFDAASHSTGFGLDGMRERLAYVGGSLEVSSSQDDGTKISARLPLRHDVTA